MYHRFEENKYPTTNIKIADFKQQIDLIENNGFNFINANDFENNLINYKNKKKNFINYR